MQASRFEELGTSCLKKNTISSIILADFFFEFISFKFWALQKLGEQESQ
jgi:hypothetical protein